MAVNDLVSPIDLDGFPGAPFDSVLVDSAVAQVRARAGWHIAPVRTETVILSHFGGSPWLVLPTRRLVSVNAIRVNGVAASSSTFQVYGSGMVLKQRSWLRGWDAGTIEVDLTHGYPACPDELLSLVASLSRSDAWARDPSIASVTRGPFSESYRADASGLLDGQVLERYTLPAGVA